MPARRSRDIHVHVYEQAELGTLIDQLEGRIVAKVQTLLNQLKKTIEGELAEIKEKVAAIKEKIDNGEATPEEEAQFAEAGQVIANFSNELQAILPAPNPDEPPA